MSGFANHLHKCSTDYTTFIAIRKRCEDSVPSNVEVPSAVNATRWNSELKCSETFHALRAPIEVMTANPIYRNTLKYRLLPGLWKLNDMMCECLEVRLLSLELQSLLLIDFTLGFPPAESPLPAEGECQYT
jgi:hypothetical protein